jgi:hypothetical protein
VEGINSPGLWLASVPLTTAPLVVGWFEGHLCFHLFISSFIHSINHSSIYPFEDRIKWLKDCLELKIFGIHSCRKRLSVFELLS